jgi:hypothetical protein
LRLARSYGWKGLALLASASAALLIIAAAIVVIEVLVRQLAREAAGYSESTSIASWLAAPRAATGTERARHLCATGTDSHDAGYGARQAP